MTDEVRPAVLPHCSCIVRTSARAWQGCSSSVRAFTTVRALPAFAMRCAFSCP